MEALQGGQMGLVLQQARALLIVPLLKLLVVLCLGMSVMLFVEKVYMGIVITLIKLFRRKPEKKWKWEAVKDDVELGNSAYPMVLVQIPMYNEKEVYQLSIGAACGLSWPSDRVIIQVLDDSTDPAIKLGGVAVNSDECLMTRMQEMSLDYHFTVEQEVGSATHAFFGFNGTAGVWRIAALNEAGGWKDRTTVEDMDLAVRASLRGWKFIYLSDLKVKNELPSTFKAYRYQQHRWSCGPANLFRKMAMEIVRNKKVSPMKKFHVIYSFFFVRKIVAHVVTFVFYCIILPVTVFVPEVQVPIWGAVYIPSTITLLNAVGTPRSLHLLIFWILFENVMSLHRTKATLIGLFEAGRVNEWVVTEKLGDALKTKSGAKASRKPRIRIGERLHMLELIVGSYLSFCGCYDLSFGKNGYFIYLFIQSIAFFIAGVGYVGTFVPNP
ncbi:hypothetical protein C1H46_031886 [Malus baccata]|uniref:Glycosyltransferase 2-like domain-containing protein n=1 Tax=Malus baccata TaxID=106549 RepID=A0A540L7Z0_MALBA|nr:hypothetical protein C1H46_031886 [Malus baccata]